MWLVEHTVNANSNRTISTFPLLNKINICILKQVIMLTLCEYLPNHDIAFLLGAILIILGL